jgi:electron transfer flavoprotein alpha subunit
LYYRRGVFGGRVIETLASTAPLTAVCIKPKAFTVPPERAAATAPGGVTQTIVFESDAVEPVVSRIDATTTQQHGTVALEDASIIVSGGRGVNGTTGFAQLDELARLFGGALGASRAAVDMGWIASAHQVGQTGKTVAPEVYLAVGISGAMQHLAGIASARRVVAINSDDQAPIFSVADVGVVADAKVLLPLLLDEIRTSRK